MKGELARLGAPLLRRMPTQNQSCRRRETSISGSFLVLCVTALSITSLATANAADLHDIVSAYSDLLAGVRGNTLLWKDGTEMPIEDEQGEKSFEQRLKNPSIADQMVLLYPKGQLTSPPDPNADPGRFRNQAFFNKMYGDCEHGEVQKHLVKIVWMPKTSGKTLEVTSINGVNEKLSRVSDELDKLPKRLKKYAAPSAGTFNCRVVKDTGNRSMHAWGAAIDINTNYANYWLWEKGHKYENAIPAEIVAIFERNGFIWGGKWDHFDTMHFEYRPELLK
jgi:hypothetical protein